MLHATLAQEQVDAESPTVLVQEMATPKVAEVALVSGLGAGADNKVSNRLQAWNTLRDFSRRMKRKSYAINQLQMSVPDNNVEDQLAEKKERLTKQRCSSTM